MHGVLAKSLLSLQVPFSPSGEPPATPFMVGEVLEYTAHYQLFRPGSSRLEVAGVDTIRGEASWRFVFKFDVSFLGLFSNHSTFTSWTGITDFSSRRFIREVEEKGKRRRDEFNLFPDSGFYRSVQDSTSRPTVPSPLDDVSFFYFLRRTELVVGRTYRYNSYFRKANNPVVVEVLARRTLKLFDGSRIECLELHPIVDTEKGMFTRRSQARVWLTDDSRRLPVIIQSTYPFGTVKLTLSRIQFASKTDS